MSKAPKTISVEVTKLIRFSPEAERERLSLHFKGKSLKRLLSMVDNMETGNFYDAAKTYLKECTPQEREAVGMAMTSIIEGVGDREVHKKLWAERNPGQAYVESYAGVVDEAALDYPRYALVDKSRETTLKAVLGDTPAP